VDGVWLELGDGAVDEPVGVFCGRGLGSVVVEDLVEWDNW
jgi:hypothetical protein